MSKNIKARNNDPRSNSVYKIFIIQVVRKPDLFQLFMSWSSLDKGESLACQITSPFNKNIGWFCNAFLILFSSTTQLIVVWQSYLASQ